MIKLQLLYSKIRGSFTEFFRSFAPPGSINSADILKTICTFIFSSGLFYHILLNLQPFLVAGATAYNPVAGAVVAGILTSLVDLAHRFSNTNYTA